jgi:hypothetical protein
MRLRHAAPMRRLALCVVLLLVAFAGCLASDEGSAPTGRAGDRDRIVATLPQIAGAQRSEEPGAVVLVVAEAALPYEASFGVPDGATMVRFVADPGADATVGVAMSIDETGRRRCNQQSVVGFAQPLTGERSCSSLTALDPPGTLWSVTASGTGSAAVRFEFYHTQPDGVAGRLHLDRLSQADHAIRDTDAFYVESFDGTPLWVEVTVPAGDGPWPTIIAASPYNLQVGRLDEEGGTPAMWDYWTHDWAKRGYAAVNVDVRGFGLSGGCVEVWGESEQRDQAFIVEWVASQAWSDGKVGFYGQSYVGTTPVAAAVQAPDALKAIIAVAPVIDSYFDWHFGGVPNGESSLSPAAYQAAVDALGAFWVADDPVSHATDIETLLFYASKGICDPTLVPLANDPRAIHNGFYDERDFGARAGDVRAAVLYTQGFEDANVKSAMIPDWFNAITAPKLGVFGHWLHQHPARMDQEVLFVGWMDHYVKGVDIGFADVQGALVSADREHHRHIAAWPDATLPVVEFGLAGTSLDPDRGEPHTLPLNTVPVDAAGLDGALLRFTSAPFRATAGIQAPILAVRDAVLVGQNAFLYAALYDVGPDGSVTPITYGMRNLAHDDAHETYTADRALPFDAALVFRPTETLVHEGHSLRLDLRSVALGESIGLTQPVPGMLQSGAETRLIVPVVAADQYEPMPLTARP